MFFRRKQSPSGRCVQLLEAYRNAQGEPRHRVVVSLGDASVPEAQWAAIAQSVSERLYGQPELVVREHSESARQWIDQIVRRVDREGRWRPAPVSRSGGVEVAGEVVDGVLVGQVEHTDASPVGPSWVGWEAWCQLGLSQCLAKLGWSQAQVDASAATVIHRLVAPGSERALQAWLPQSALPELWGRNVAAGGKDRFYRISDKLLAVRAELEAHLRERTSDLFQVERNILLYDLTNSYFEGEALRNPKAQRGCSKEKRNDCPQVVLGMVFDAEGFALAHRVFAGRQSDGKSLAAMAGELAELAPTVPGQAKPLVIVDGGVATRANLARLRESGFHYLVNESRRGRGRYAEYFRQASQFEEIAGRAGKPTVRVRLLADPFAEIPAAKAEGSPVEGVAAAGTVKTAVEPATAGSGAAGAAAEPAAPDQLLLCKSEGRQAKEAAICSQAETRFVAGLERLARRVAKGQLKDPTKIYKALGRLEGRYARARRFYEVELVQRATQPAAVQPQAPNPPVATPPAAKPPDEAPALQLRWKRQEADYEQSEELFGCYVLRTDQAGLGAKQTWELYMTLTQAEQGFRALKGDLGLRPNWHQLEGRVDGHIFITVLAYHLMRYLLHRLEETSDHRSWPTIKRILGTHTYATMLLPTKSGTLHRIRQVGRPGAEQEDIYRKLKLQWKQLPKIKTTVTDKPPSPPSTL